MSWQLAPTRSGDVITYRVIEDGLVASRAEVLVALRDDPAFRATWIESLRQAPFEAFFWETPPTRRAHQDRPYEHVLVNGPALAGIEADVRDFQSRFSAWPNEDVLAFPNLGGDATLVVPAPRGELDAYAHLATFVRSAPPAQVDALFAKLARTIEARLGDALLWVSTAGLGVSWLHLRLDARPKYYRHAPYKTA